MFVLFIVLFLYAQDSGFLLAIYSKTQKIQINIYIHIQIPTILTHHKYRLEVNNLSSFLQTHKILGNLLAFLTIENNLIGAQLTWGAQVTQTNLHKTSGLTSSNKVLVPPL